MIQVFALDYIVLKLAEWQMEATSTSIQQFNSNNNFTKKKLELLPIIITTANGAANRELLHSSVFNDLYTDKTLYCFSLNINNFLTNINLNVENRLVNYTITSKVSINCTDINQAFTLLDTNVNNDSNIRQSDWINTKKGIDHSIDKIFKEKYNKHLYAFSEDQLEFNLLKDAVISQMIRRNMYPKYEEVAVPLDILYLICSVFAEELESRLYI